MTIKNVGRILVAKTSFSCLRSLSHRHGAGERERQEQNTDAENLPQWPYIKKLRKQTVHTFALKESTCKQLRSKNNLKTQSRSQTTQDDFEGILFVAILCQSVDVPKEERNLERN